MSEKTVQGFLKDIRRACKNKKSLSKVAQIIHDEISETRKLRDSDDKAVINRIKKGLVVALHPDKITQQYKISDSDDETSYEWRLKKLLEGLYDKLNHSDHKYDTSPHGALNAAEKMLKTFLPKNRRKSKRKNKLHDPKLEQEQAQERANKLAQKLADQQARARAQAQAQAQTVQQVGEGYVAEYNKKLVAGGANVRAGDAKVVEDYRRKAAEAEQADAATAANIVKKKKQAAVKKAEQKRRNNTGNGKGEPAKQQSNINAKKRADKLASKQDALNEQGKDSLAGKNCPVASNPELAAKQKCKEAKQRPASSGRGEQISWSPMVPEAERHEIEERDCMGGVDLNDSFAKVGYGSKGSVKANKTADLDGKKARKLNCPLFWRIIYKALGCGFDPRVAQDRAERKAQRNSGQTQGCFPSLFSGALFAARRKPEAPAKGPNHRDNVKHTEDQMKRHIDRGAV